MNQPEDGAGPGRALEDEEDAGGLTGVEVVGPLHRARFPGLCVKCGTDTDRSLPVTKLFWHRGGDNPSYHYTAAITAPFCAGCIGAHERELGPIPPEVRRKLLRSWFVQSLPFFFPLGVNLWLLTILGPNFLGALARGEEPLEIAGWAAFCAFFGLLAVVFYRMILRRGRALILKPAGTSPQYAQVERGPLGCNFIVPTAPTSVLRAVDFSEDRSELFDRERHLFRFRNREVAERFAELNDDREWDPASPRAQLAGKARMALFAAIVLAGLYFFLVDFFR